MYHRSMTSRLGDMHDLAHRAVQRRDYLPDTPGAGESQGSDEYEADSFIASEGELEHLNDGMHKTRALVLANILRLVSMDM